MVPLAIVAHSHFLGNWATDETMSFEVRQILALGNHVSTNILFNSLPVSK